MSTPEQVRFQIEQLRQQKMVTILEMIVAFLFALFIVLLLPQILVRYIYATATTEPFVLQHLPTVVFVLAILYTGVLELKNMARSKKIASLEKELMAAGSASLSEPKKVTSTSELAKSLAATTAPVKTKKKPGRKPKSTTI